MRWIALAVALVSWAVWWRVRKPALARPARGLWKALSLWRPYRLTLSAGPVVGQRGLAYVYAWLWWNYAVPAPHQICIFWGERPEPGSRPDAYAFETEAELTAFIRGVNEGEGWADWHIAEGPDARWSGVADDAVLPWTCGACGRVYADVEDDLDIMIERGPCPAEDCPTNDLSVGIG